MGSKGGGSVTVGYHYYMNVHFSLAHGGVDELLEIRIGDRPAWKGNLTGASSAIINQVNLFGGESREGGVLGLVDFMPGDINQPLNPSIVNSVFRATGVNTVPAYRGVSTVFFKGFDTIDMTGTPWDEADKGSLPENGGLPSPLSVSAVLNYFKSEGLQKALSRASFLWSAMNPYFKPPQFLVRRVWKQWYPSKAQIGEHVNPIHIIYECMINKDWGLGYPSQDIDDANFKAAADVCYNEGFGLSLKWTNQTRIKEFIMMICEHINANWVENRETGKFQMIMIRDDYNAENLFELNQSNCRVEEFQRKTMGETVNEVVVSYTRPEDGETDTVTVQDLANFSNTGQINSQKKEYPGIQDPDLAFKVALRDLNTLSKPIAKFTLICNADILGHYPGDVVKLNWPSEGLDGVVLRIVNMKFGGQSNRTIRVEAIEDAFGLPQSAYIDRQPIGWVDPARSPEPITEQKVYELSYYELYTATNSADRADWPADVGFLGVSGLSPNPDADSMTLYDNIAETPVGKGELTPRIELSAPCSYSDTALEVDMSSFDVTLLLEGGLAWLGDELVEITDVNTTQGTVSVNRGMVDTVPDKHPAGEKIWLYGNGTNVLDPTERVDGEEVEYKLITETSRAQLKLEDAPVVTYTLGNRLIRPYRPGNLRVNGQLLPDTAGALQNVTWSHRDRTQELTVDPTLFDAGDIGPENNVTYNVAVLDENGQVLTQNQKWAFTELYYGGEIADFDTLEQQVSGIYELIRAATGNTGFTIAGVVGSEVVAFQNTYEYQGQTQTPTGARFYSGAAPSAVDDDAKLTTSNPVYTSELLQAAASNGSDILSFNRTAAQYAGGVVTYTYQLVSGVATASPTRVSYQNPGYNALCLFWDAANSRYALFLDTAEFLFSTDGQTWGSAQTPAAFPVSTNDLYSGTGAKLFKAGSYYYLLLFQPETGYQSEVQAYGVLRATDLTGTWEKCPGTFFTDATYTWEYFRPKAFTVKPNGNLLMLAWGEEVGDQYEFGSTIVMESTDGLNFTILAKIPPSDNPLGIEQTDIAVIGNSTILIGGDNGALVSTDAGVNWSVSYDTGGMRHMVEIGSGVIATTDYVKSNELPRIGRLMFTTDGQSWDYTYIPLVDGDIPPEDLAGPIRRKRLSGELTIELEAVRTDPGDIDVLSWQKYQHKVERTGYGYNYGNYYGGVV